MLKPSIFFPGETPLINARTVLYFEKEEHYPGKRIYTRLQELLGDLNYPEAGFLIFDEEMSLIGKPQYRTLEYSWIAKKATKEPDPETSLIKRLLNFFIWEHQKRKSKGCP
ncbi:MAG: hypothetical protein WCO63_13220 [Bacteroidota bacterium]